MNPAWRDHACWRKPNMTISLTDPFKNLLLARPLVLGAARVNRSLERTASGENMTFSWTDPFTRRAPPAAQPGAAAPPRALSRPRSACRLAGAAQAFPRHNGQSAPDRGPPPARP